MKDNIKNNISKFSEPYIDDLDDSTRLSRACKRGRESASGVKYPKRPFSNKRAKSKRKDRGSIINEIKRELWKIK